MKVGTTGDLDTGDRIIARRYDYTVVDKDGKLKYTCFYRNLSRTTLLKAIDEKERRNYYY